MARRANRNKHRRRKQNQQIARQEQHPTSTLQPAPVAMVARAPIAPAPIAGASPLAEKPVALGGARQTQPSNANPLAMLSYHFLPRRAYQYTDLGDAARYGLMNAQQLLELSADLSAEVSMALWNVLRTTNSGWTFEVRTPTGTRELKSAKGRLEAFLNEVNKDWGGIDAIIDSWTITAYLQGAIAGEIELTEDLNDVVDIHAVQPWTIHFMRDEAQRYVPFQQQIVTIGAGAGGNGALQGYGVAGYPFRRLNPLTFGYLPIDAAPDDPYGRPPAAPVLQLLPFDLQLLKDIRQAVHTNAWGRLHIKVMEEVILKNAPVEVRKDPTGQAQVKYVNSVLTSFRDAYEGLKPDDAFFTSDAIELKPTDYAGSTFDVERVIRMLERRIIRALKQLPVLMGSNEGTTETHGTVQMEIYAAGIESFQRKIAALLEKLCNVALQTWGISGKVKWTFDQVRASDRLKDAQADKAEAELAAYRRDQGWITQDDASIASTGSEAVETEPLAAQQQPPEPEPEPPEPGQDKPPNKAGNDEDDQEEDDQEKDERNWQQRPKANREWLLRTATGTTKKITV